MTSATITVEQNGDDLTVSIKYDPEPIADCDAHKLAALLTIKLEEIIGEYFTEDTLH